MCDVVEECSQNELITDEGRRAFESWHRATFFKRLKIVTVGFFSGLFFSLEDYGASSFGFFGDSNHNQILCFFLFSPPPSPSPPPLFFHFVIGSLFNLVKKIGLAWERQNSFGERFCCFRVVHIVLLGFFFFSAQGEKVPVCAKTS